MVNKQLDIVLQQKLSKLLEEFKEIILILRDNTLHGFDRVRLIQETRIRNTELRKKFDSLNKQELEWLDAEYQKWFIKENIGIKK